MRDDSVLEGFTEMKEEPVDSRITKNSASWKRALEQFIASEVKRIKKTYQSREECMKDTSNDPGSIRAAAERRHHLDGNRRDYHEPYDRWEVIGQMTKIDWSAASVKELMENGTVKDVVGKAAEKIKAEAAKPVTLNLGYVSDDGGSTDGRYRDAILKELARLRGIAPVGEVETIDERIDELLILLMDMEGGE